MKFWQSRYNPQLKLSQQDLRNISEEIIQTYTPYDPHHQPELVLMPVDPLNLYAYWNLAAIGTDNVINDIHKQFALRIYSLPEHSEQDSQTKLSFDIKVSGYQNQKKVHLPIAATAYAAIIGEIKSDDSFCALATSDIIHVPRENPVSAEDAIDTENGLQTDSELRNTSTIMESFAEVESKGENFFILKNFNEYGYDLKIYGEELSSAVICKLSDKTSNIYHTTKNKIIDNNTSGQGCK